MQPLFVDLHTHTTASDGSDSPTELVKKAAEAGLAAVAITDHDTVSGLDEACEAGKRYNITVVRGCELSVSSQYGEVHLLGLWLPEDCSPIEAQLFDLRDKRDSRNERILERLHKVGVHLSLEQVLAQSQGETVGRPHIAGALLKAGYVTTVQDAFARYLGKDGSAFEPKEVFTPEDGVRLLANLGATVSVAHPMLIRCPLPWLEDTISDLASYGLTAVEAYHSEHSAKHERCCAELAGRHNLGVSGGSDYHGLAKPHIRLGRGKGGLRVTLAVYERLLTRRRERGLD